MAGRRRSRKKRPTRRRGASGEALEWIGGRLLPPFFIEDREEPYRVEMALWMELPAGLVVGQRVLAPEDASGAVGRVLRESLERPLVGPPRRPGRIRVADPAIAEEVRGVVGDEIPVVVAPTPELDAFLAEMVEGFSGGRELNESYVDGGRIPAEAVADLFDAARVLHRVQPWETATDDQVLRLDVPALGVEGACVAIIGHLGESLGFLVFPSLDGYDAFQDAALEELPDEGSPASASLDLGTEWLSLTFERGSEIPASLRREIADHGWPVASPEAYPCLVRRDCDGVPRPLVPRDLAIATACARALPAFFLRNAARFETDDPEPVCESYRDDEGREIRFTLPYEAFPLFDVPGESPVDVAEGLTGTARTRRPGLPAASPRPPRVGRNAPCPCGSGRKYKKCCMRRDEEAAAGTSPATAGPAPAEEHELDQRLVGELVEVAHQRFGQEWGSFASDFAEGPEILQLAIPWAVYHHRVQGATACEHFLAERGASLGARQRRWLAAQQAAWLSVWEVIAVEPGESLEVQDLLSHEMRRVHEIEASRTLVVRDAFLGRVVDTTGVSLLCGIHPRSLPPLAAAEVVRRARGRLRRRRAVPVERLRDEAFGRYLIRRWEEAVDELDAEHELRRAFPPELQNTDGDPFLFTTDHFEIAPGEAAAVEACLADLPGAEPPDPEDEEPAYVFLREGNRQHASWESTVIGRAQVEGSTLRLETNSRERADALRSTVEAACGPRIRHRAREHADPLSKPAREAASRSPAVPREPLSPEMAEALREFKGRHYADWPDQPLPALNGLTPRQAARTAAGCAAVDALLKDMEHHEHRLGDGAPFDFSGIRRELRLE